MKKFLTLIFALLTISVLNARVAFLVPAENTSEISLPYEEVDGAEQSPERRAWWWFNDNYVTPGNGQFICFNNLDNIPADVRAIWIYVDRINFPKEGDNSFDALFTTEIKAKLQAYLNAGGNLFLCKQATRLEKDLVGARNGQNSEPGTGDIIEPDFGNGGYRDAAIWGVDYKFFSEEGWGSYQGHRMYAGLVHHNTSYAELIWSDGRKITDNNCGIGVGAMGMGDRFDRDKLAAFQTRNNCRVLGGWANDPNDEQNRCNRVEANEEENQNYGCFEGCHYGGVIEFYPTGVRKGTVITFGLAAYSWINNNGGWGFDNTQAITRGVLDYLNARPCAGNNTTPMEEKLAEEFFYPSNTTTFRTLHPVCEDLSAAYSLTSNPDNIARIVDVQEGENTVKKLQFKAAGTVNLHIALTENREFMNWPKGTYEYDREITFAYADADAAQKVINEDFPGNGVVVEEEKQMAMRLHPSVRGMDSVSYTITNHYDETQGEAYKKTEDGVTRLYFSKSGKVLLNIRLNEPNEFREEWPAGNKDLTRVVEFNYTQEEGPTFPWPAEFTDDANPKSVITFPETVEGLAVTYSIEDGDNASLENNVLTLADVTAGHVTVHASVTETDIKVTWPVGTYNYSKTINFVKKRPKSGGDNPVPMEEKLAEEFFYPSNTTTFRTLHPVCEDLSAAYSLTSNPDGIARIVDIQDGENTVKKLQFKAAGTVTLHIVLTESRGDQAWEDGDYEYDREITFSYANPNAAQEAVEADLSSDGKTDDRFMLLHPNIRGLDSVSYTIVNDYEGSGGQALKVKDSEDPNAATRLCFTHEGSVQLQIKMNETDWVEAWPMGEKDFTKVVTFTFERPEGPTMNWPLEFFKGGIEPNSVITLPAQIEGLTPTYTVTGDATLEGNTLTVGDVISGSFTVTASVTENDYKPTWPKRTYQFEKSLPVYASEVGYLLPAAEPIEHLAGWYDGEQPEYNAAKWFQDTYIATRKGRFVTLDELPTLFAKGIKTLWVNIERINITTEEGLFTDMPAPLKTYIQAGGNVLLTKQATRLAYLMERIGYAPEFNAGGYSTENTNNLRSIATCMGTGEGVNEPLDKSGHRLYSGMLSYWDGKNVFLVAPDCKKTMNYCSWQDFFTDGAEAHDYENNNIQRLKDFENAWSATVFGIQGSIGDYCFSDVVEFNATGEWQGRILAIGSAAYQWGTSNNHVELENMKTLTSNALSYLLDKPVEDEVYTRDIMNNMYGTICWGYAVEEGHIEGAEMYELTSFNATGDAIILTEVNSMRAGRAYFFFGTSDQLRLTYHGQKKEAEEGGHNGLVGYIPLMGSEPYRVPANDNKYILYYDELLLVDSEIDLPAHRAYVNYEDIPAYNAVAPAGARRRVMSINRYQAPTGLEAVEHSAQLGSYDSLGRKVNNPQSAGFYIINGKKVIITQ